MNVKRLGERGERETEKTAIRLLSLINMCQGCHKGAYLESDKNEKVGAPSPESPSSPLGSQNFPQQHPNPDIIMPSSVRNSVDVSAQ